MLRRNNNREGMALVVTLWVMVILVVTLLGFSAMVRTNVALSGNYAHDTMALNLAKAALKRALIQLEELQATYVSLDDEWAVMDSETDEQEFLTGRYEARILDECGKLNLNRADEDALTALLGDPALVDPILDWRDEDSEVREQGAEDEYYLEREVPYYCKNGPFETLSELLLVANMTRELFYGQDLLNAERSVLGSLLEEEGQQGDPAVSGETKPLVDLLTLYSVDTNTDQTGQPRLNLRTATADELEERFADQVEEGTITEQDLRAIVSYRGEDDDDDDDSGEGGGSSSGGNQGGQAGAGGGPPTPPSGGPSLPGGAPTGSAMPGGPSRQAGPSGPSLPGGSGPQLPGGTPGGPAQLGGSGQQAQSQQQQQPGEGGEQQSEGQQGQSGSTKFEKLGELINVPGWTREKVAAVLDGVTVTDESTTTGRVNVNTAPLEVLMALPLMTEEAAEEILSRRQSVGPFTEIGEILSVESLTDAMFVELADHLTVRSYAFRILADGVIDGSKTRRRIECIVVVDEQPADQQGAPPGQAEGMEEGAGASMPPGGASQPGASRQASGAQPSAGAGGQQPPPDDAGAQGEDAAGPQPPQRTVRLIYWKQ